MWVTRVSLVVVFALAGSLVSAQQPPRPPQGPPGTVTLTLAEYDRLLNLAEHPVRPPEPPPIPAVLSRGSLSLRVDGDRAAGAFALEGEVFRAGIAKVPLVAGATLLEARLERGPLPLVREGQVSVALVEGPRPFSIALGWGTALETSPGRASFIVPVPLAGSVTATLDLPGEASDVRIEPGAITATSRSGGVTRVEATLVPGQRTRVSWSSRHADTATVPQELRTSADLKTLLSVGEADLRLTTIVDVTVLRGTVERLELRLPPGFAVTAASGSGLDRADERPGLLVITPRNPSARRHQFIVSLERGGADAGRIETLLPTIAGAERETGELAIEAVGTIELTAHESDALRRIDVREASAPLRSLARLPILAALRYHRRAPEPPLVAMDVVRFPDAPVIAAVADSASVTTLLTAEGRTLTEVSLQVRNRAQPFVRVALPAGATMVSAEVAGESVKLAHGADGVRVPLLRPGFRPNGEYTVSFVYLHTGTPFAKKGRAELALPKMDVPVGIVHWEMFVPDRYRVKDFDGNALLLPAVHAIGGVVGGVVGGLPEDRSVGHGKGVGLAVGGGSAGGTLHGAPGQIAGRITDAVGNALPGATVSIQQEGTVVAMAVTDAQGQYAVTGLPSGMLTVIAQLEGFNSLRTNVALRPQAGRRLDFRLPIGNVSESVTVDALGDDSRDQRSRREEAQAPSQNVVNLQRRVSGVLPVRIEVPRAGSAYRFARPLVLDEVTRVSFEYRRR